MNKSNLKIIEYKIEKLFLDLKMITLNAENDLKQRDMFCCDWNKIYAEKANKLERYILFFKKLSKKA